MSNSTVWEWRLKDKSDAAFDKLGKKFKKSGRDVDDIEGKSKKFTGGLKKGLRDASAEIPGLNRGLSLIKNPLILGASAALGFGAAIAKGTREAKKFNYEFLELQNLNLDKSKHEIESLKRSVLDVSFDNGLNATQTSKAFFDVQSATGKYGKEVEKIVGSVGKFAQVMKADFNSSIEGATKAMGIFGFGAEKIDDFLASNFKTVQVGITTFDQLAKVQTEYAKSAASAGQGFNEANKLFAVFSANEKNADIAATKTKGAFEDLTKARTIKGFKKLGLEIFDAGGNTKKLDQIVEELVPKLKGMSDTKFSALKEEIGGNEGLRGLLDSVKGSGDKVLETFRSFDSTDFDFDKALANANGNLQIMSDIVDNKLTNSWIRFGDKFAPIMLSIKKATSGLLDDVSEIFDTINNYNDRKLEASLVEEGDTKTAATLKAKRLFDETDMFDAQKNSLEWRDKTDPSGKRSKDFIRANLKDWKSELLNSKDSFSAASKVNAFERATSEKINIMRLESAITKAESYLKGLDPYASIVPTDPGSGGGAGSGGDTPQNLTGISGAAKQVRNVTVNIQNLVRELTVNKEGGVLSPEDLSRQLEEILIKAVHDGELALSS